MASHAPQVSPFIWGKILRRDLRRAAAGGQGRGPLEGVRVSHCTGYEAAWAYYVHYSVHIAISFGDGLCSFRSYHDVSAPARTLPKTGTLAIETLGASEASDP